MIKHNANRWLHHPHFLLQIYVVTALIVSTLFMLGSATAQEKKILTIGREGNTSFTRNFNPFSPSPLLGTFTAIYERLIIYNPTKGEIVPWLASAYKWSEDGKQLTFTVRDNVQWSDGQPFTAKDAAFSFNLRRKISAELYPYVDNVQAPDDKTVVFNFKTVYSPALYILGELPVVPEHIWKDVDDPVKFTNPDPVGTGPFTQVVNFQNQVYELHKNPYYWQEGKPAFDGIRYPAFPGNDQVTLALINGEIDWADIFIPDIDKTFIAKDPENYHYWFARTNFTAQFLMNTTVKPYDDPKVRKAVNMAINREQIVKVAMFGYTRPADCTGLSDAFNTWKNPEACKNDWTKYNPDEANKLLDEAGLKKGADGFRTMSDGTPIKGEILVGAPSTDWVASSQIIAQNLKAVGLDVTVKAQDWGFVIEQKQKGQFTMAHSWSSYGATPFDYYRGTMSSQTFQPVGTVTNENYHRYVNADADKLLDEFAATFDLGKQKEIMNRIQVIFAENAPTAPLFPSPEWGEYNTKRFTGFPNADNQYATLASRASTAVIVLTTVKPK